MKVYAYVSRELYNEVLFKGRVYPILGISCSACSDKIYKAYERRFKKQAFFAWDKEMHETSYGDNTPFVYLELELPKGIYKLTNYLNWTDLIMVYDMYNNDGEPSDDELKNILNINGFLEPNLFRNIDQLWDDIYQIDRDDTNQVMYDYLDKSFIKRAIGVNEPVVTI